MIDEELDELILSRLKHRLAQFILGRISDATQSPADLAVFFNEPEHRVQARLRALAGKDLITESAAAPDRWLIPLPTTEDE